MTFVLGLPVLPQFQYKSGTWLRAPQLHYIAIRWNDSMKHCESCCIECKGDLSYPFPDHVSTLSQTDLQQYSMWMHWHIVSVVSWYSNIKMGSKHWFVGNKWAFFSLTSIMFNHKTIIWLSDIKINHNMSIYHNSQHINTVWLHHKMIRCSIYCINTALHTENDTLISINGKNV